MAITNYVEIICFIIALICLIRDTNLVWRSLVLFLFLTCVSEICGRILRLQHHHNQWIYNIFLVFEASFTSIMFNNVLSKYIKSKPLVLSGLALLTVLYIYDLATHGFLIFNSLTTTVMSVIFVLYSLYYYFLLINDEHYINIKRSAPFWWVSGALFFYFGSTVANLFFTSLDHVSFGGHNITYYIFTVLSITLYGCWSYSFICKKWLTTTLAN